MISLPGKVSTVFEIQDTDVVVPEKVTTESSFKPGKMISKYVAPSTSVLVNVKEKELELIIGRNVSERVLRNVLGFGLKSKKPMKILKCEVLSNLRDFDRMVVLCNSIIQQQEEIDLNELFRTELG